MHDLINKGIMAIVPEYIEGRGNCVKVYTNNSQPIIIQNLLKLF